MSSLPEPMQKWINKTRKGSVAIDGLDFADNCSLYERLIDDSSSDAVEVEGTSSSSTDYSSYYNEVEASQFMDHFYNYVEKTDSKLVKALQSYMDFLNYEEGKLELQLSGYDCSNNDEETNEEKRIAKSHFRKAQAAFESLYTDPQRFLKNGKEKRKHLTQEQEGEVKAFEDDLASLFNWTRCAHSYQFNLPKEDGCPSFARDLAVHKRHAKVVSKMLVKYRSRCNNR